MKVVVAEQDRVKEEEMAEQLAAAMALVLRVAAAAAAKELATAVVVETATAAVKARAQPVTAAAEERDLALQAAEVVEERDLVKAVSLAEAAVVRMEVEVWAAAARVLGRAGREEVVETARVGAGTAVTALVSQEQAAAAVKALAALAMEVALKDRPDHLRAVPCKQARSRSGSKPVFWVATPFACGLAPRGLPRSRRLDGAAWAATDPKAFFIGGFAMKRGAGLVLASAALRNLSSSK